MTETDDNPYLILSRLCEADPGEGLRLLNEMNTLNPELLSDKRFRAIKMQAHLFKATGFQQLLKKTDLDIPSLTCTQARELVGEEDADQLELALREVTAIERNDPEFIARVGFQNVVDSFAAILERCRPGRVQEILGKTKLSYFGISRIKVSGGVAHLPPISLRPYTTVYVRFPWTVRSVFVIAHRDDASGTSCLMCAMYARSFEELSGEWQLGDANQLGLLCMFPDGRVVRSINEVF
jgi:hypothetical protein